MSLGLDPFLGSGDPNFNLAGEIEWDRRQELAKTDSNHGKLLAWDSFETWLNSTEFQNEYKKHSVIRESNRKAFPDASKPGDMSQYRTTLAPILSRLMEVEINCPDKLRDIGKKN